MPIVHAVGDDADADGSIERFEREGRQRLQDLAQRTVNHGAGKPRQPNLKKLMATFDEKRPLEPQLPKSSSSIPTAVSMLRRKSIWLACAVVMATLSTAVVVAKTYPDPANLAGRPYSGDNTTSCQGTVYAMVGGMLSLLTAGHCKQADYTDVSAPGGGAPLGYWLSDDANVMTDYDLAVIVLYANQYPSDYLNHIYRGAVSGANYWTITQAIPTQYSCGGMNDGSEWGRVIDQNWQSTTLTTIPTGHPHGNAQLPHRVWRLSSLSNPDRHPIPRGLLQGLWQLVRC